MNRLPMTYKLSEDVNLTEFIPDVATSARWASWLDEHDIILSPTPRRLTQWLYVSRNADMDVLTFWHQWPITHEFVPSGTPPARRDDTGMARLA